MKTVFRGKLAIIGVVAAASFGSAGVSAASAAYSQCPSSRLCVWDFDGATGAIAIFNDQNNRWSGFYMNDRDNSSYNRGRAQFAAVWSGWLDGTRGTRVSCVPNGSTNGAHAPRNTGSSNSWYC